MTATATPLANGRPRKSLASQLDRLDSILDGLDQGLAGAITDAIKEVLPAATAEAVRATIVELVTNPDIITLIRTGGVPIAPSMAPSSVPMQAPQPAESKPNAIARAWRWTTSKVKGIGQGIASRVRGVREGAVGVYRQASSIWSLRRPVLISLGVGMVVGMICYASSPWLAGMVSGLAASVAALGVQLAVWARRVFASYLPLAH